MSSVYWLYLWKVHVRQVLDARHLFWPLGVARHSQADVTANKAGVSVLKDLGCFCCLVIIRHMRCSCCLRLCFFHDAVALCGSDQPWGWTAVNRLSAPNLITSPASRLEADWRGENPTRSYIKHTFLFHTRWSLSQLSSSVSSATLASISSSLAESKRTKRTAWPTCFTSISHTPTLICCFFYVCFYWPFSEVHVTNHIFLLKFFKK